MTNREWLCNLDNEEMAKLISNHSSCDFCSYKGNKCMDDTQSQDCENGICEWLNSEHDNPMPEIKSGDVIFYEQNRFKYYAFCVYGNIVYAPSKGECCNYGGEMQEKTISIKRYNVATGTLEDIWRADNE